MKRKLASRTTRKPASRSVVDLKAVEAELNNDAKAQAAFIRSPSKFLEDRGFKLRTADKAELKGLAAELKSGPKSPEGSDAKPRGPFITISIRRRIGRK
ncbi:MAG: hypothetical protein AAB403_03100 [Planctomycetota bacterium]